MVATVPNAEKTSWAPLAYAVAPFLFAVMWSTGFVGARFGLPYAEPLTFLVIRFAVTITVLLLAVAVMRAAWPRPDQMGHLALVGILAHAGYLGSNFYSMSLGMPLALVALVGGLQPLLTAIVAGPFLGERVNARMWAGLCLGLVGVCFVLWPKLGTAGVSAAGVGSVTFGLFAMTSATLYQKRFCPNAPLLTGSSIQFVAALVVVGPMAYLLETGTVQLTGQFVFAVVWLSLVLSLAAMTVLWLLVRRGAASKVVSMFYLVPPFTALFAYLLFGEKLSALAIVGMALAASGVALVTTGRRPSSVAVEPAAIE